jgi:hypothetical protein
MFACMAQETTTTRRDLFELAARAAMAPAGLAFLTAWKAAGAQAGVHKHGAPSGAKELALQDYRPQFFSPADFQALQSFTEILIPTDETPGAKEAHCAAYIDFVLSASTGFAPEVQAQWRQTMAILKKAGFHDADSHGRAALVAQIAAGEHDPRARHEAFPAYLLIKKNNTFAFYTSRAGMIDALDYRGNSYNISFPACTHPEHHEV